MLRETATRLNALKSLFRIDQLLVEPDALAPYATDYSGIVGHTPLAVVFVESHGDIVVLTQWANENRVSLVCRGGGSNTTGAAVGCDGGVVVSFDRMIHIEEIDPISMTVRVQPGVTTMALKTAVEAMGLEYPPDPGGMDRSTIGGNVATNAGGPNALAYGVTGDYVIGLKGVFGNGRSFELGGAIRKNVAGYDVLRLLVGSEGTLGILSSITLALLPKKAYRVDVKLGVSTLPKALALILAVRQQMDVCGTEFFDSVCAAQAARYLNQTGGNWSPFTVIVSIEAGSQAQLDLQLQELDLLLLGPLGDGVESSQKAVTPEEKQAVWAHRRAISPALKTGFAHKQSHDVVVPVSSLEALMMFITELSSPELVVLGYGHLGDGNVHVNIVSPFLREDWEMVQSDVSYRLLKKVVSLGGSITGEHGVGRSKVGYLSLQFDDEMLAIFRSFKHLFDPKGVLNPGVAIG